MARLGKADEETINKFHLDNLEDLIEFSNSWAMERNNWIVASDSIISELPKPIFDLLYSLRLRVHEDVPYEDYIKIFDFVVVDDVIYHDNSDYSKTKEKRYLEAMKTPGSIKLALLPSVIIKNNYVIKNRYGKTSAFSEQKK